MMAANLVSAPMPDYPMLAKIAHIGGEVILQAVISKNGTVSATRIMSGHRLLRGAAQDAVRRWRYRPYVMDGHPVEVATIVTVRFKSKQ
jgi:protein TonB